MPQISNLNPKFSVGKNSRDQQTSFTLKVFLKLLIRLLRIFFCLFNFLLTYKILIHPFLTNLYYQKSGSSFSSVSLISPLSGFYFGLLRLELKQIFCSFFRAAGKEAIIIFWTTPIECLEIVMESLSALINIKISLRDFLKK